MRFALGKDIQVVVSPPEQIEELIKQHYGTDTTSMAKRRCQGSRQRCNYARLRRGCG
jgi:hypothetical protein